jgi:glycerol-3-phosphate dehydrogenase
VSDHKALTKPNDPYDIVVLGGGITGAGIARDAALRGLRVALFEKDDFGSGTSSKSSKLIHGGLRYLEQGEIGLVFESVSERRVQGRVAPHLVRPMPFLVPIYESMKPGLELINIGLWIYDTLALFRAPKMHKTYRGQKAKELEPQLMDEDLKGALEYYDCITDDARLVLENIIDAKAVGAECCSYTEVTDIDYGDDGKIEAVRVVDRLTGDQRVVPTRALVIAAGPWSDGVAKKLSIDLNRERILRPTKGVHLVFPRHKLPLDRSITLMSPVDGRVMFAIPWRGRTVIGTTDTDYEGRPEDCHADFDDVEYLCASANRYFPAAFFKPSDVIATWSGLRPLVHEDEGSASDVSREHEVFVKDEGIVMIAGGKLTTYRLMAKECVRTTLKWFKEHRPLVLKGRKLRKPGTKKRPLPGADGLKSRNQIGVGKLGTELAKSLELRPSYAVHLASVYGTRARLFADILAEDRTLAEPMQDDLPFLWAEVVFAARHDCIKTIDDALSRRIPLLLVGTDQGLDTLDRVTEILARELGWSAEQAQRYADDYRAEVARSREFRPASAQQASTPSGEDSSAAEA